MLDRFILLISTTLLTVAVLDEKCGSSLCVGVKTCFQQGPCCQGKIRHWRTIKEECRHCANAGICQHCFPTQCRVDYPEFCINQNCLQRCWSTYVPRKLAQPVRLVMDLHGYTGSMHHMMRYTGWKAIADKEGLILSMPQGTANLPGQDDYQSSWNAGGCCGGAMKAKIDDIGFLRKVVSNVTQTHGISIEIHGGKDQVVNFTSFNGSSAKGNIKKWSTLNQCVGPAKVETVKAKGIKPAEYTIHSYTGCNQNAEARMVVLPGVGHTPYKSIRKSDPMSLDTDVDTTQICWEFMKRRPMRKSTDEL